MAASIGIDFGTRYCRLAYLRQGEAQPLGLPIPIWQAAGFETDPGVDLPLKQCIGETGPIPFGGQLIQCSELVMRVFGHLRDQAARQLNEEVVGCVVSVPTRAGHQRRDALRAAIRAAGFRAARLINQSAAIALSQSISSSGDWHALIYCLGASRLEIAIVRRTPGSLAELASAEHERLTGQTLTDQIFTYLLQQFRQQERLVFHNPLNARQQLLVAAERLKIQLSYQPVAYEVLPQLAQTAAGRSPADYNLYLNREIFEALIRPHVAESLTLCQDLVTQVGLTLDQIEAFWLAGGSTTIPFLQREITQWYGRAPLVVSEYAAALGAVLQTPTLDLSVPAPPPGEAQQPSEPAILPTPSPAAALPVAEHPILAYLNEANRRLEASDHEGALEQLQQIVDWVQQRKAYVHFRRGQAHEAVGEVPAALAAYECAAQLDGATLAYQQTGLRLQRLLRQSEALSRFQQGREYEAAKKFDEALRAYIEASKLDGENATYRSACAWMLYQKAMALTDNMRTLLQRRREKDVTAAVSRAREARECLDRALAYTPDSPEGPGMQQLRLNLDGFISSHSKHANSRKRSG